MTATPETVAADSKPHLMLAGLAQQASHAYRFARADRQEEASEHLRAIERLTAAYRQATDPSPGNPTDGPIHGWFSLSYSNYQVLHRTLMQSMPIEWQERMVACLEEMRAAFEHVEQPECFEVQAATEHIVNEMGEEQLKAAGITVDWYRGETPPDGLSAGDFAEWEEAHEDPEGPAYSRDGEELDGHQRVFLPVPDPIPHYRHSYIPPRLGGGE